MAKTGLSYYRAETDRFQDIRIKRLKKEFQGDGYSVYSYILNEIYRVKGCFLEWDESTAFDVSEYWGLKESKVNEIVKYCCAIGLFDKGLFTNGRVITSRAIQKRFVEISKIAKRSNFEIPKEICLLSEEVPKVPEEKPKLPEVFDKVKYSKEKERKEISPSIPQGGSGGAFFNLNKADSPPSDGVNRNYEALVRNLNALNIPPDDFNKICELSNYGEIGNSVWKAFESIKKSSGKITMPGKYIISIIRKNK